MLNEMINEAHENTFSFSPAALLVRMILKEPCNSTIISMKVSVSENIYLVLGIYYEAPKILAVLIFGITAYFLI
jgi:hypothetical protein